MADRIHMRDTGKDTPGKKQEPLRLDKMEDGKQETKARQREIYETDLLIKEQKHREDIKNLTYNTVHDAIEKLDEVKQLIGDTRLQKPDIRKMCAFRHNDGRILLGSIEHVTEAFNKSGHQIAKADLGKLEVGSEKNGIKRIRIDEELITILKERGFKADIAKRGADGQLEKIGTLHANWDEKEGKMNVKFEKHERDPSKQENDGSSQSNPSSIEFVGSWEKKNKPQSSSDDSPESVVPVTTIDPAAGIPAVTTGDGLPVGDGKPDATVKSADTVEPARDGKSEMTEVTKPTVERQGIHKEIHDIMGQIQLNAIQLHWEQRRMNKENLSNLYDAYNIIKEKLNEVKDDTKLKIIKQQLELMKESVDEKVNKYPQQLVKENKQKRINFNQEISEVIKAFRQNLDLSEYSNSQEI